MAETFEFEEMTRLESKLSVSIYGPAGSGKTTAAFKLAAGIRDQLYPGKTLKDIALFVDTEKKSSSKAVGKEVGGETLEPMDVYDFGAPYDIYRLAQLIEYAVSKGKKIIVTDSFTHFWSGTEGILERVADLEVQLASNKKAYGAWSEKEIIQKKNALKNIVANENAHMIFCLRAKTDYSIERSPQGKVSIQVVGVKEDMQPDVPYEHDVVLSIRREDHGVEVIKDRIGFLEYRMTSPKTDGPITKADGKELAKIVSEGISIEEIAQRKKDKLVNFILEEKVHKSTKLKLFEEAKHLDLTKDMLDKMSYNVLSQIVTFIK